MPCEYRKENKEDDCSTRKTLHIHYLKGLKTLDEYLCSDEKGFEECPEYIERKERIKNLKEIKKVVEHNNQILTNLEVKFKTTDELKDDLINKAKEMDSKQKKKE